MESIALITSFSLLFMLVLLRMPFAFAFVVSGVIGVTLLKGWNVAMETLAALPYSSVATFAMVPLPLFILMGQIVYQTGISKDLFDFAYKTVGRFPGGIALATNITCTAFAACTGSSLASAATMGVIALPEMKEKNYSIELASGVIAAGGTLGILIPPSTMFIIYGFLTEQSIGKLFIAGIVPGLILSGMFSAYILIRSVVNPAIAPPGPKFPIRDILRAMRGIIGMLCLFVLIIGGMYMGAFTPSEAGAAGAFGAFVLGLVQRRLGWKGFWEAARETALTSAFILVLLVGVSIFNSFLVQAGFTSSIEKWLTELRVPPRLIVALIVAMYIPMGMFMDTLAMLLLMVPIFAPLVKSLGFDLIWFGVITVVMVELALITPPIGMNCFVLNRVSGDIPLSVIFKGVLPFALLIILCVTIIFFFPDVALFLPGRMM